MNQYKMKPFVGKPIIEVTVPGSKSITNRALLLAALSEGKSVLKGVLFSDDSRVFMEALKTLGYEIDVNEKEAKVTIVGHGTQIPKQTADVYVGSAGTAARFLTAMLAQWKMPGSSSRMKNCESRLKEAALAQVQRERKF